MSRVHLYMQKPAALVGATVGYATGQSSSEQSAEPVIFYKVDAVIIRVNYVQSAVVGLTGEEWSGASHA
jgi:hypothetical protein